MIIVDFHAEATSEKVAMGWYSTDASPRSLAPTPMCRRPTSGSCPKHGVFTDAMTGPHDSIIGVTTDRASKF